MDQVLTKECSSCGFLKQNEEDEICNSCRKEQTVFDLEDRYYYIRENSEWMKGKRL